MSNTPKASTAPRKPAAAASAPAAAAAPAIPVPPAAQAATGPQAAKPGSPAKVSKAAKASKAAKPAKPPKAKKPKTVRDSFTIPKDEYAVIDALKIRAAKAGSPAKKSELLRAGIKALAAMSDTSFLSAIKAVPAIKTGRPAKA